MGAHPPRTDVRSTAWGNTRRATAVNQSNAPRGAPEPCSQRRGSRGLHRYYFIVARHAETPHLEGRRSERHEGDDMTVMSEPGWVDLLLPRPKRIELRERTVESLKVAPNCPFHRACTPIGSGSDAKMATLVRTSLLADLDASDSSRFGAETVAALVSAEAYAISLRHDTVVVTASDAHGLQHGMATLRQIEMLCKDMGQPIPELDIVDWPDSALRGAHVCYHLVREWLPYAAPDFDELMRTLGRFAQHKLNTALLELEAMFPFQKHNGISCSMAFSVDQIAQIAARCRQLRIEAIPLIQCLGHQYYLLEDEGYRHQRETPDKTQQLCPTDPQSAKLVLELVDEYTDLMPDIRTFHLGGDESRQLGDCARCNEKISREGPSALYVDHVATVCEGLLERGLTPMIWSDMLEHHPDCMERIPKETTIAYWNYDLRTWPREYAAPVFVEAGFDVVACHGVRFGSTTSHVAPDYATSMNGVVDLTRACIADGVDGFIATNWTKAIPFELSWRGYLCAAWESWTSGVALSEFDQAYAATSHGLYGDDADALIRAQGCLAMDVPYAEDAGRRLRHRLNRFDLSGSPLAERIERYTSSDERERIVGMMDEGRARVDEAGKLVGRIIDCARRNRHEIYLLDLAARTLGHKLRMGTLFDDFARWQHGELSWDADERSAIRASVVQLKREWCMLAQETEDALGGTTPSLAAAAIRRMKFEVEEFREIETIGRLLMEAERVAEPERFAQSWVTSYDSALRMPYLECSGSPFERGYAHGSALRDLILRGVQNWLADTSSDARQTVGYENMRRYVRERFPDIWQAFEGVARGADVAVDTIFDLNAFNATPSCTAMAVAGDTGELLIGGTLDVDESQRQFSCVYRATDESGRQMVASLWAGTLWVKDGLNSDGLGIAVTSAPRIDGQHGHGLPQHLVAYAVLDSCANVPEALGLLADITCSGKGINMVLADRQGRVAAVEKSYDRQAVSQGTLTSLFRTNHFVSPEMLAYKKLDETNSRARFERLRGELAAGQFADPDATVRRLLSTHSVGSADDGVCQHNVDGLDTLSSSIVNPVDGWIEICGGKPCSDPFVRFEV
jgi:predicted choloylglycine hydrolase